MSYSNYILTPYKKGGNYLMAHGTFNTDEYVRESHRLTLFEDLAKDEKGKTVSRFRLCTKEPMRYTDTLEFDIGCPYCHNKLRLCGLPVDAYTHGLYKCSTCDERGKR